jgi:hypothetical protein
MMSSQININIDNSSSETGTQTRTCHHTLRDWSKHRGVTPQSKLCLKTTVLQPGTANAIAVSSRSIYIQTLCLPLNQISVMWQLDVKEVIKIQKAQNQ